MFKLSASPVAPLPILETYHTPSNRYPPGNSVPVLCPVGTYSAQTRAVNSEACQQCPPGQYCREQGTTSPQDCSAGSVVRLSRVYLGLTGGLLGVYLGFTWGLLGVYLVFTWGLLGVYLGFTWAYLGFTGGLLWVYLGFT